MSQSTDKKNARKFWWVLMIFPIGIAIGTVTSVVHHLRQNEEAEAQEQFKVAVALNAKDIHTGMEKALIFGDRNLTTTLGLNNTKAVQRFIQGSVSPGGTGLQFSDKRILTPSGESFKLSYVDIPGAESKKILAVIIELVGSKGKGDAAKLGLTPSLIRSLAEAQTLYTIRFILTPETQSAAQHGVTIESQLLKKNQQIHKVIVLKEQAEVALSDANDWKELTPPNSDQFIEITHPVLLSENIEEITPKLSKAVLNAADQLRNYILNAAN